MTTDDVVVISHDAFGRFETVRRCVSASERKECRECGGPGRFQYGTRSDGLNARVGWMAHTFCSVGCMRCYHGL